MFHIIIALISLMFHWHSFGVGPSARSLESVQWKHRVLAYVVADENQRLEIEQALEREAAELEDRDLLLVNLGEIDLRSKYSMAIGEEEKELWRKLWQLDLSESRFVLIGKDGGAKAFQRGGLDVELFFDLIDGMPMRRAEMRSRGEAGQIK